MLHRFAGLGGTSLPMRSALEVFVFGCVLSDTRLTSFSRRWTRTFLMVFSAANLLFRAVVPRHSDAMLATVCDLEPFGIVALILPLDDYGDLFLCQWHREIRLLENAIKGWFLLCGIHHYCEVGVLSRHLLDKCYNLGINLALLIFVLLLYQKLLSCEDRRRSFACHHILISMVQSVDLVLDVHGYFLKKWRKILKKLIFLLIYLFFFRKNFLISHFFFCFMDDTRLC